MLQNSKNIEEIRKQNLETIKDHKINPYPSRGERTNMINEVINNFEDLLAVEIILCGRLRLMRRHGKATFSNLEDGSGNIQIFFSEKEVGKEKYRLLRAIEVGDYLQVAGHLFITKKGEKTLMVKEYSILAKALKSLPEKWHGIKDEEEKLRKRYLDILFNPQLKDIFKKKALFWQNIRRFLIQKGFLEVETPVLEVTPGGADAKPFKTHHNALNIDLYLRISMGELWQKKLMIAGYEKTFEIGRQFRNEGIDTEHLQDYTQMEFYMAYADYKDGMKLTEEMYKEIIKKTFGTLKFKIKGYDIDFAQRWTQLDYASEIKQKLGIDVLEASEADLQKKCEELDIKIEKKIAKGRLMDILWKKLRKEISGPAFIINHPVEVSPLSKRKEDDNRLVERFQIIIAGSELGNGYSELNDPIDQENRFKQQAELRKSGDEEAQMHDKDFVEALEYGMPPTCGFGLSERLFSYLVDKPIRETVIFPLMRPKNTNIVQGDNLENQKFNIKREIGKQLLNKYIKEKKNLLHSRETEVIMRSLAKKLGKNEDLWGMVGLLHDIDWEKTKEEPDQHTKQSEKILNEINFPEVGINAIKAHNYEYAGEKSRETDLDYALACSEAITGIIYAAVLVRPDKNINQLKTSSVKKKLKDKSFAANIDRARISECEKIGLTLDEFIEISIKSMQEISTELGL